MFKDKYEQLQLNFSSSNTLGGLLGQVASSTTITGTGTQQSGPYTSGTGMLGTAGYPSVIVAPPQQAYPTSYLTPRLQHDREGTWVELDPDEPHMPVGIILWKNGQAKKVTLKELLRQAGLEW